MEYIVRRVYDDELYHYGVKGMRWGVRRRAKKDAKEYARASMFYGDGAGNRRKLIKAKVEQRSKDPDYKKAFEEALEKQDMSKHVSKAKKERVVKDIINLAADRPEKVGAGLAAGYGAYMIARSTGADKVIAKVAKKQFSNIANAARTLYGKIKVEMLLKKMM